MINNVLSFTTWSIRIQTREHPTSICLWEEQSTSSWSPATFNVDFRICTIKCYQNVTKSTWTFLVFQTELIRQTDRQTDSRQAGRHTNKRTYIHKRVIDVPVFCFVCESLLLSQTNLKLLSLSHPLSHPLSLSLSLSLSQNQLPTSKCTNVDYDHCYRGINRL